MSQTDMIKAKIKIFIWLPSQHHAGLYIPGYVFLLVALILPRDTFFCIPLMNLTFLTAVTVVCLWERRMCACVCDNQINVKVLNQFPHRFSHVVCSGRRVSLLFYSTEPLLGKCNIHHVICSTCEILGERL